MQRAHERSLVVDGSVVTKVPGAHDTAYGVQAVAVEVSVLKVPSAQERHCRLPLVPVHAPLTYRPGPHVVVHGEQDLSFAVVGRVLS